MKQTSILVIFMASIIFAVITFLGSENIYFALIVFGATATLTSGFVIMEAKLDQIIKKLDK